MEISPDQFQQFLDCADMLGGLLLALIVAVTWKG